MELPVNAIPSEDKKKDPRLEKLEFKTVKLPATFMMLGRCGSGKSSILWSLLTKAFVYKKKSIFHEMIVYLGSQDSIDTFKKLPCKNLVILQEFNPTDFQEYLDDLKKHQMERISAGKYPRNIAVVFDDFVGQALLKSHNGKASPLERLILTSRHECNMTLFFCSQVYKNSGFSTPSVRNNVTTYIISNMSSPEMAKIAEDQCQDFTPKQFLEIYDEIQKTPYNYMVIDYRRPLHKRITERFTGEIISPSMIEDAS